MALTNQVAQAQPGVRRADALLIGAYLTSPMSEPRRSQLIVPCVGVLIRQLRCRNSCISVLHPMINLAPHLQQIANSDVRGRLLLRTDPSSGVRSAMAFLSTRAIVLGNRPLMAEWSA